ncbi:tripartite motif-containing protein 16-like [Erpetoichthys calabaricus]|uniref:tripartite motif-containing protein 16-like n=1 Tax=Erpetoichthys calabaricus TaxID=27687 RepID=UPI0010A02AE5|nr:tripartite motif-containing protein 16-like [Erpetoichthys calabaricus]
MMAEAELFALQDEFTCLVCLDSLSDPVSIPCGHSFCLQCLTDCWDQSEASRCPQCRKTFTPRPELNRNTLLNEIVIKLKETRLGPFLGQNYSGAGDVECDFCTGQKKSALKTCLTCLASFCLTHLQPHYEGDVWKDHELVDPDGHLQRKVCTEHQKCLEFFCQTDETCICLLCGITRHNGHEMVKLSKGREEKQKQLGATLGEVERRLEERQKKLKEMMQAEGLVKISADREVQESEESFAELLHFIEDTCRKVTEKIRSRETREVEKTKGAIQQLEKEIEELRRSDAQLRELLETEDHVHFLQTFATLPPALPDNGDLLSITVATDFLFGNLKNEVSGVRRRVSKIGQLDVGQSTVAGNEAQSREEFLQHFLELTMDSNTSHAFLHLYEEDKKATFELRNNGHSNHSDRFSYWSQVLCKEVLTGTRYYWEVEWSGFYVCIGVTYKGISRKQWSNESRLGYNNKSWYLCCSRSRCSARHNNKETVISTIYGSRIGVYLDHPAGLLSFYNVSNNMALLHTFNASFTEPLYAGFEVGFLSSVTICKPNATD